MIEVRLANKSLIPTPTRLIKESFIQQIIQTNGLEQTIIGNDKSGNGDIVDVISPIKRLANCHQSMINNLCLYRLYLNFILILNFCRAKAQLKYHCAVLSADLRYRWSPRTCTNHQYFVCQHRMPFVSEKNRNKIYQKWNETYPNELANEVEVIVSNSP